MIISNTVKTEKQANEILNNWLTEQLNSNPSVNHGLYGIDDVEVQCECGECSAKRAFIGSQLDKTAVVAFCDCCGDDAAFIDEILIK